MDVAYLVKLRKQLCRQIDTGDNTVEDATKILDCEREGIVECLERGNCKCLTQINNLV